MDYTPVGQVIAPYVSLVAIFIAAIVIGYITDGSVKASGQVQTLSQLLPPTEGGQLKIVTITETLATYATEKLEELLQLVETKEGRFQKLKRELKEELAIRADVELWCQPTDRVGGYLQRLIR